MKTAKLFFSSLLSISIITACNNSTASNDSAVADTTGNNPTTDAMDYHPDQRQQIPTPDSSNTIGTDTINGSASTPNTGTQKSYNDKKGSKDSTK